VNSLRLALLELSLLLGADVALDLHRKADIASDKILEGINIDKFNDFIEDVGI